MRFFFLFVLISMLFARNCMSLIREPFFFQMHQQLVAILGEAWPLFSRKLYFRFLPLLFRPVAGFVCGSKTQSAIAGAGESLWRFFSFFCVSILLFARDCVSPSCLVVNIAPVRGTLMNKV